MRHIAAIILNFNTEEDSKKCTDLLARQTDILLSLILVDNFSSPDSLRSIENWINSFYPNAVSGTEDEISCCLNQRSNSKNLSPGVFLVKSNANHGYSAGNNIGIRIAEKLQVDAVFIANPDMRIENTEYLSILSRHLYENDRNYIAASRIHGLDGQDQNPLRESSFLEELLWPLTAIFHRLYGNHYVIKCGHTAPHGVPKVSGCCLLFRMSFIKESGYLDENVFLYCEESILSSKVHNMGGIILYVPDLIAVHAHIASQKGNKVKSMQIYIKSRRYYLKTYSGYSPFRLSLLNFSYTLMEQMHLFFNSQRAGKRSI